MAIEDTQPTKRSPGRPRKAAAQEAVHHPKHAAPEVPTDPRIGESVGDERVKGISFPDGTEYRCENGVIVERIR